MDNINTPEELFEFMSRKIEYGYLGKNGRVYHVNDTDFDSDWFSQYILQGKDKVLRTLSGNCWDQVELERNWFVKKGYEIKTIYEMVCLDYENEYPTHSYLIYKDDNKWCWFENSDYDNRGIKKFDSIDELFKYQYGKYLSLLGKYNITKEEIEKIVITEFDEPEDGISAEEYINHALSAKKINMEI